jgi:hypothetical protein
VTVTLTLAVFVGVISEANSNFAISYPSGSSYTTTIGSGSFSYFGLGPFSDFSTFLSFALTLFSLMASLFIFISFARAFASSAYFLPWTACSIAVTAGSIISWALASSSEISS